MATSILQGLGSFGSDIGQGAEGLAKDRARVKELQMRAQELGVSQEYADIAKERFGLEKQQATQPKYLWATKFGNKVTALVQKPDGSFDWESHDIDPGSGGQLWDHAQSIINRIQDPTQRQNMTDLWMSYTNVGDYNNGIRALAQESSRIEGEQAAATRQQKGEEFQQKQQQRTFTHQYGMEDVRQKNRIAMENMRFAERKAILDRNQPKINQGLNALYTSLHGGMANGQMVPGLDSVVNVLDSDASRAKLAAVRAGEPPDPNMGIMGREATVFAYKALSNDERQFAYQLNRAFSAIQSIRAVTGLPRATDRLMASYANELPNPTSTPNARDAMTKIKLIDREIRAALTPNALYNAMKQDMSEQPGAGAGSTGAGDQTGGGVPGEEEETE